MRRLTLLWIVWSRGGMTMLISIRTWRNSLSIWIMVPRCRVIAHSLSDAWLNLAIRQVYKTGLRIVLIYYPPYHSKYNPIERCWAALENYWDGAILSTVDTAVQWATNMQWKGSAPVIHLVEKVYEKGISVGQEVLEELQQFWKRSETLPKWDVVIEPT